MAAVHEMTMLASMFLFSFALNIDVQEIIWSLTAKVLLDFTK